MRLDDERRSENVEDRRGSAVGTGIKVGGGAVLLLALVAILLGEDPRKVVSMLNDRTQPAPAEPGGPGDPGAAGAPGGDGGPSATRDPQADFAAAVLATTEDAWGTIFREEGGEYQRPTLVLFSDAVDSACGYASAAVGPFYCPGDHKVYLDLAFFRDLDERFGAPGDFARAYVIAHEIGHHVQALMGVTEQISAAQARASERKRNELSVRLELQADCLAGVWASRANRERRLLEPGDVEEGLAAAAAIGDDRLQRESRGRVQPESWTHGSSQMRVRWLRQGLEQGRIQACDTFAAGEL